MDANHDMTQKRTAHHDTDCRTHKGYRCTTLAQPPIADLMLPKHHHHVILIFALEPGTGHHYLVKRTCTEKSQRDFRNARFEKHLVLHEHSLFIAHFQENSPK
jgi:hypothetical protein